MRKLLGGFIVALCFTVTIPVSALEECAEGMTHVAPFCFTPDELTVFLSTQTETEAPRPFYGSGVERWRPWVEIYFQPGDVDRAMRVLRCESGGNPSAVGGVGEIGLFQHHPRYWAERSARYGWGGWSAYSPDANVAVAAAIIYNDSRSWLHWTCRG